MHARQTAQTPRDRLAIRPVQRWPPGTMSLRAALVLPLLAAAAARAEEVPAWPECSPGAAGGRGGLSERCCLARRASYEAAANGGCDGEDSTSDERCRLAESLCDECFGTVNASSDAVAIPSAVDAGTAAPEGVALASLGPEALQLRCAQLREPVPCVGAVADIGLGIVVLAGVLLLVVSMLCVALFDRRLLPPLLARLQRPLLGEALQAEGGTQPPPPEGQPSTLPQEEPPPRPHAGADVLRLAAAADIGEAQSWPGQAGDPTASPLAPPGTPPVVCKRGRWPERMAAIWASRSAFIFVAELAVVMRLAHILFCVLLSIQRNLLVVALETVACVLPLVWCALTSRPPKDPAMAWPEATAYSCHCRQLPRFTAFSVATVAIELHSTISAAWVVALAPCDVAPWRVILPYCLGVVVAVVRAYSAMLALRLQDDFLHTCTRVLPVSELEGVVVLAVASKEPECAGSKEDFELEVHVLDLAASRPGKAPLGDTATTALPQRRSCCWPWASSTTSRNSGGIDPPPEAALKGTEEEGKGLQGRGCCRCCRRSSSCQRCRKRPRRWILLGFGFLVVVISATVSTWVLRALNKSEKPRPPSACVTAQNGTATCQQFEMVGMDIFDGGALDSRMDLADTEEDCCRGCDDLDGCQAWMFERAGRRCRWIRFLEDPCQQNPGDLRCRCLTHFGTAFGFKPTGKIIWLHRAH